MPAMKIPGGARTPASKPAKAKESVNPELASTQGVPKFKSGLSGDSVKSRVSGSGVPSSKKESPELLIAPNLV